MLTHKTTYRVIYGDTDGMGIAYYANYLRWFEVGRSELFRSLGFPYKTMEEQNVFLPVSEVYSKFHSPLRYDDILVIETSLDTGFRAGMKFDYRLLNEDEATLVATGYTKHAFMDANGRVVRPPASIKQFLSQQGD